MPSFYIPDRHVLNDALSLMDDLGDHAASEAAARADRSRDLGNIIHFCRWRQIGRVIDFLASGGEDSTVH